MRGREREKLRRLRRRAGRHCVSRHGLPHCVSRRRVHTAALAVALLLAVVAALAGPRQAAAVHEAGDVGPLYDRTLKCDALDRLAEPPQLVVFGGSRAQRFEPSVMERLTGLSSFNFAVQNCRPEDAYTIARYLFWKAPGVKLHLIWALQVTTMNDSPLHPGLLAEKRLNQFLPEDLVADQRAAGSEIGIQGIGVSNEFTGRGCLRRNGYDDAIARGLTLQESLQRYLAEIVPRAASPSPYTQARAKRYFERTLKLFNMRGVSPVLVIMPYHPTALAAFRSVGWDAKSAAFKDYLLSLRDKYDFYLLDYLDISSFGGDPGAFYDGAHIKSSNARRILAQAIEDVPQAFR